MVVPSCYRLSVCEAGGRAVHLIGRRQQYGGLGTEQLKELKRPWNENEDLRRAVSDLTLDKLILTGGFQGKLLSSAPAPAVGWACRAVGPVMFLDSIVPRNAMCREVVPMKSAWSPIMIELSRQYGRYGCRRIAALLRDAGWSIDVIDAPARMLASATNFLTSISCDSASRDCWCRLPADWLIAEGQTIRAFRCGLIGWVTEVGGFRPARSISSSLCQKPFRRRNSQSPLESGTKAQSKRRIRWTRRYTCLRAEDRSLPARVRA